MAEPAVAGKPRIAYDRTVDDDQLRRLVKNAGMEIFAGSYDSFTDPTLTAQDLHRRLVDELPHHCPDALWTRVYAGRKLVTDGLAHAALRIIANAPRVRHDLRRQARALYLAGDGAGITAGSFTVDVTATPRPEKSTTNVRQSKASWYVAPDGVVCADVHGKHAGAVILEVEPTRAGSWTARARGFLAVIIHEIKSLPSEEAAQSAILDWWSQVKA